MKKKETQFPKNDLWFDRDEGTVLGTCCSDSFPRMIGPAAFAQKLCCGQENL